MYLALFLLSSTAAFKQNTKKGEDNKDCCHKITKLKSNIKAEEK